MHDDLQKPLIIKKAMEWAEKVWKESNSEWINRPSQDFAYRKYVVDPTVLSIAEQLGFSKSSFLVDLGCGDGTNTLFWRRLLNSQGFEAVPILGIDLLKHLVVKSKENSLGCKNIYFEVCDISTGKAVKTIIEVGHPDVVVAMFVLQDIPDLEGILRTVSSVLREGGHFIAVFVHPDFAEYLFKSGHIKVLMNKEIPEEYISSTGVVQWRFWGYYPIAQEGKPPFYVPYFHRYLQDYCNALESFGLKIKKIKHLMPDQADLKEFEEENILPFAADGEWNVYWPQIIKGPSSILIHSIK